MTLSARCRWFLVLLLLAGVGAPTAAQPGTDPPMQVSVHIRTGYTSFSMNEASDFFRTVVGVYREAGINVPIQQMYPGHAVAGGGVSVDTRGWSAGLHVQYARTEAAALYGDVGGTLDVTSETSVWTVESSTDYTFRRNHRLQPFVGARAGRAIGRYQIEERLELSFDGTTNGGSAELTAAGTGFSMAGYGGLRYHLGRVALRGEAGYRYASIGNDRDDAPFDLNYSGPVMTFGVDIPVWRIR